MSSVAVPAGRPVATPDRERRAAVAAADAPLSMWIELPLFAALAAFGMAQWARLVEPSAAGREAAALLAVCAAAVVLRAAGRIAPGLPRTLCSLAIAVAGLAAALLAAGLPSELLAPAHWDEFSDQIQSSVGGIEQADLPYDGPDDWIRLSLVLGAPALVAYAAAVAFWPTKQRGFNRACALVVLLATYGVGVTLDNPGAEVLWGVGLLVLSAAWLWIARLEPGRRVLAVAVAVAAGILALPLAARLNAPAWWDYESWSWFGAERSVQFQWNHEYGPLDWPREGTTLMTVETDTPLYWKASVLDRFDGYTWSRATPGDPSATAELQARAAIPGGEELIQRHPEWVERASFELLALNSDLVIGAGVTNSVDGDDAGNLPSADGTLTHVGPPLERGDEYSIVAYVPQPSPRELRRAPAAANRRLYTGSTLISLPTSVEQPLQRTLKMPLWDGGPPETRPAVFESPYADTYRLAREWTAGASTQYEAVREIEQRLRSDFNYTPTVDQSEFPLISFLFADEAGYCQQFAGSMGLMLRMLGIPSRVVSGFAPGAPDADGNSYEVRDFDAHSWVEVYFRGIGWVTFDPTPGSAPAESQQLGGGLATALTAPALDGALPNSTGGFRRGDQAGGTSGAVEGGGGLWDTVALGLLAALVLGGAVLGAVSWRRRGALLRGERSAEQVDELAAALRRLGWELDPGATLMAIEDRAAGSRRTPVRRYAAALRKHRYGAREAPPPGPSERRALRRALGEGSLARRLRALLAIPPGGPAAS